MTHRFHSTVLREYDIRGIIGETLGAPDAYAIGRGFGTLLARDGGTRAAVGYDGRLSSPMLEEALVRGLNDAGIDAVRVGMGPRQMQHEATHRARHAHADLDEHEPQAGDLGVRE